MDCRKSIIYIESIINCREREKYLSNKCDLLVTYPKDESPLFSKIERLILMLEIISKNKATIL